MRSIHQSQPANKGQLELFEGEEVRPVPGHESMYLVTSHGRVFSINYRNTGKTHELAQSSQRNKRRKGSMYQQATMHGIDKRNPVRVHRIVALAFIPNPYGFNEVNHIDGNKANNHASNLEWVSASQNRKHAYETGLSVPRFGEENGRSVLTKEKVLEIRADIKNASNCVTLTSIALKHGVARSSISNIKSRRTWRHVA